MPKLITPPITFPKWTFKIEIRTAHFKNKSGVKVPDEYFYAGVSVANGQDLFDCESQKRKYQVIKTAKRLFPYVVIVDKTGK